MKNPNPPNTASLTSREIVELIETLRAQGATTVKIGDIEVSWAPIEVKSDSPNEKPEKKKQVFRNGSSYCGDCSDELVRGNWGLYCKSCYLRTKEDRYRQTRRWK
jgi:hypothetical protein